MDELFRDRVRERDLDNFLVEELYASRDFLTWFVGKVSGFAEPSGCVSRLRKSPPRESDRRQTDVRIGWFADGRDDMRACVLIESKVTADFQPGQAEAYAGEAAALRERIAGPVATVLVAPAARLGALAHGGAFDADVSIEDMIDFIGGRRTTAEGELALRLESRVQLLEALCGRRTASAWVGTTVPEKRDFAQAYAALAAEILPDLWVKPSTDGPNAITRIFDGLELPGLPRVALRHEFGSGSGWKYANALFAGASHRVDDLRASAVLGGTPYAAEPAGKSLAIRVRTPTVDPNRPFAEQSPAVLGGLEAIRRLIDWLRGNVDALGRVLVMEVTADRAGPGAASVEREFAELLRDTYRECERLNYRPTGLLRMLEEHGGIGTARRLLANPPSDGFGRLAMLGRLDLSIESLVLQDRWNAVFTDDERRLARRRLS